jgi:6-phosphogluconolactonase
MLYAALRSEPFSVSSFAIDPIEGRLTYRGTAPMPAPMAYISTNRQGNLLLGASYKEGKVSVSRIAKGVVEGPAVQVITTPPKAHCVVASASANTVYVPSVTGNAILVYRVDPETGIPLPADPPSMPAHPGSGPRHVAFHPQLDVLYCVNETAGSLAAFGILPDSGALTELQYEALMPAGYQGNARAADVHVTPDGRFVYASVRTTHKIHGFRIDPTSGRMSPIGVFDVAGSPRSFAIDPTGGFLISGGQDENIVATYAIDPNHGTLTPQHRYSVGLNPNWVETLTLPVPH